MKYLILSLVMISSLCLNARELTRKEKLVITTLERTDAVKGWMTKSIKVRDLSFSDYLSYQVLRKSCDPLRLGLVAIEKAGEELPDQSEKLLASYLACAEGALGLSKLYVTQQPQ